MASCVSDIAVETMLETKKQTVSLRKSPSIGSQSSYNSFKPGAAGGLINDEEEYVYSGNGNDDETKKTIRRRTRTSSRCSTKSHHEYVNVGVLANPTPPLPPRNPTSRSETSSIASREEFPLPPQPSSSSSSSDTSKLLKRIRALEETIKGLQETNNALEETVRQLKEDKESLTQEMHDILQEKSRIAGRADHNKNSKDIIAKYTCMEVQSLLFEMGLAQYVSIFASERINGAIFLELDEVILEFELNVSSNLHRKRLMHVIRGVHHVFDIMKSNENNQTLV